MKDIKIFQKKKKKKKSGNMVVNVTKISQKMKNKSIEKIFSIEKKRFTTIIKKYFNLENFASYLQKYKKLF